jgi:hypothetical protein
MYPVCSATMEISVTALAEHPNDPANHSERP